MTPHQLRFAEQASKQMDPGKLMYLTAELCRAIDGELAENYHLRIGCREDCRGHGYAFPFRPGESLPAMESHAAERRA